VGKGAAAGQSGAAACVPIAVDDVEGSIPSRETRTARRRALLRRPRGDTGSDRDSGSCVRRHGLAPSAPVLSRRRRTSAREMQELRVNVWTAGID